MKALQDEVKAEQEQPTISDEERFPAAPKTRRIRAKGRALATVAGIVIVAVGLSVIFVTVGRGNKKTPTTTPASAANAAPAAAAPAPAPATGPLAVSLSEFKVAPAATTIAAGQVTLNITNGGTVQHELLVFRSDLAPSAYPEVNGGINEEGPGIEKESDGDNLDPGTTQTRTVDLTAPGTYLFVCNLPGHFAAGMYQVVTVK